MRKKVAIIGLGDIAQKVYLPLLTQMDTVEITALMSRSEETVHKMCGRYRIANGYTDLRPVLASGPEAVFIHAPTESHYDLVTACLEQGLHVYVDKPLCYDIAASRTMVKLAEKRDRLLAVGFNRRFAPLYTQAQSYLQAAGGFSLCSAQKHRTRPQSLSAKQTWYDDLIHMLDLVMWMGGSEPSAPSRAFRTITDEQGRMKHASGMLSFADASAFIAMDRCTGADMERLELHGGGRSVEVVNMESAVFHDKTNGTAVKGCGSWETIVHRRGFYGVVQHFLDTLDAPNKCTVRGDLVISTHEWVEKLF